MITLHPGLCRKCQTMDRGTTFAVKPEVTVLLNPVTTRKTTRGSYVFVRGMFRDFYLN
ncbi:hypothetical protein DPMN_113913 [Dreissena polymorpha]|uniref:Uncharacterized protein n=1 Tax=Dreissena polymorpha TaxID=45954 RepID=A0A9D4QR90_DREPO|nr:hypothetical protein DPMN_113913 [Dreissena polymorpha]